VEHLDPRGVDVLVLAGDIAVGPGIVDALGLFCSHYRDARVLYVHGNHEYYGATRAAVVSATRDAVRANANLTWLDADATEISGRRFLGGPLWFRPGDFSAALRQSIADFSTIPGFESWVYEQNERMLRLLREELRAGDVVVTHHLPSARCVDPRFTGSPINVFFVCDVESLILERRPALWMHGHTHSSVCHAIGETSVRCNPFGYVGLRLNPSFSAQMTLEV
jgi:Icc-related predicted phosphoesterase